MAECRDTIEELEREDTKTKLPLGWVLLSAGLIVWGIFYVITYTPQISGWTREGEYQESLKR